MSRVQAYPSLAIPIIKEKSELLECEQVEEETEPQVFELSGLASDTPQPTQEEELNKIQIEGSPEFKAAILAVVHKYAHVFKSNINATPAQVEPMKIPIDAEGIKKWHGSAAHRQPPRRQSTEKQNETVKQIHKLLSVGAIEPSEAQAWSQINMVKQGNKFRCTNDFTKLNTLTGNEGSGWPLLHITDTLLRLGDKKAKFYGILDFTSGYHQTSVHPNSRYLTAFICFMGLLIPMDTYTDGLERSRIVLPRRNGITARILTTQDL
jgi:hypothetical protein